MSVQVPAWPFPFHISQSGDKLSIQGEWHFIYSVASFTRCVSWISPIHSFVCLSSPGRNITTHPLLSLSSALPKDTVHEIRDCLQWSDRDRVAGGHILLLWFAGSSDYVIRIQLRLKRYVSSSWGRECTCCLPFQQPIIGFVIAGHISP